MSQFVLKKIVEWSKSRPLWQRDALRRILYKGELHEEDVNDLIELCKAEAGLISSTKKSIPINEEHIPSTPTEENSITLKAITEIQNVNRLASNQTLTFEPKGITIIYGDNGAGKSGYVRILKRACRARHTSEILDNIYVIKDKNEKPKASFHFNIGGKEQANLAWEDSDIPHQTLSAISVFDRQCADIQISKENEIAFRPHGLDIPDEFVRICKLINQNLANDKKLLEEQNDFLFKNPFWNKKTPTGILLDNITHATNVEELKSSCLLTQENKHRLEQLRVDLGKNPSKATAEQKLKADNIQRLNSILNNIEKVLSEISLSHITNLKQKAETIKASIDLAASNAFSSGSLDGIGGEQWRLLWEAARRYATDVAYPDGQFPPLNKDMLCVLCQEPLSSEAIQRMKNFEQFIQNDLSIQNKQVNIDLSKAQQDLLNLDLSVISLKGFLDEVSLHDQAITKNIKRFIASARLRKHCYLKQWNQNNISLPSLVSSPTKQLNTIEEKTRQYAQELLNALNQEQKQKLQLEYDELQNRAGVATNIQLITDTIERLKTINLINQLINQTLTADITKLSNQISDTVITPMLRDRFQEELTQLAADKVRVEIVRSGGKHGASQYQVKLFANPKAKVNMILSEGEQTCVAFAAFLSELATANHHSALIFDDPVSSLDHRWRNKIAKRLIEESRKRQVIVFTHDLVFVNDLYELTHIHKIPVKTQTITNGPIGAGVVSSELPWKGKSIKDRIDKLEKLLNKAEQYYQNNDEDCYHQEATSIYNKLRATWERGLEEIGFARVILRYRDYINTKDLVKVSVLTRDDCEIFERGFKKCCDITDAHDPALGRNIELPSPQEIKQDIQNLKTWMDSIKSRQNNT
ncbi:hypothetical protein Ljor_2567 [Legionella jordanis]|uniref:Protein CR006 P-loop domain-containing protein n=1 Tax=Legionella jordanis TaxID=456 RepID=A0A0W0VDQ2_9GAMM|nr:ATP-binding protein [Legionella jordanis]KTD18261.1 hypothetical protein Ljor_2567 [Legionella jordanis]VEH13396.1 hemin importer ATP-binding subunit [Legionella jordanis]